MSSSETIEIRSYRKVFDLERRIYRIDRLRLNPSGVPIRGVLYFVLAALAALALGALPLTGLLVHMFPWYIRDLGGPACLAALMSIIRIEGRPFHLAAMSLARYATGPRHLSGLRPTDPIGHRWYPSELLFLPDGSDARVRSMRFTGPGLALVNVAHERAVWSATIPRRAAQLTLRPLAPQRALAKGQVIELRRGVCLHVHGSPATQLRLRAASAQRLRAHDARGHLHHTRTGSPAGGCAHHTAQAPGARTRFRYE